MKDNHTHILDAVPYMANRSDVSFLRKDTFRHFSEIKIPSIDIKNYNIKTS